MKIMHLLKHSNDCNGNVHVAVDLACAQAAAGNDVVLASSGGSYDSLLREHGVRIETIPRPEGVRGTARSTAQLLAAAWRFGPDLLHAHMMSSAVQGLVVSKAVGAPLVTTVHNSFDRHSVLMRLGRKVVAVSSAEFRLLRDRGFPAGRLVTVLNGASGSPRESLDDIYLGPLPTPTVVTLSGLHPRKAVGDVIAAFALVSEEFPDWHLSVVGMGPDLQMLVEQVAVLGLEETVHFLGSTLTPRPLLEEASIFASASLAEPFGLAVAEARAAGCAIVATDVGGIPEVLDHGEAGQLVPASNPEAMAAAFRGLMGDRRALADWRARAAAGAEHFSVRRMAQDYASVYESLLGVESEPRPRR